MQRVGEGNNPFEIHTCDNCRFKNFTRLYRTLIFFIFSECSSFPMVVEIRIARCPSGWSIVNFLYTQRTPIPRPTSCNGSPVMWCIAAIGKIKISMSSFEKPPKLSGDVAYAWVSLSVVTRSFIFLARDVVEACPGCYLDQRWFAKQADQNNDCRDVPDLAAHKKY